MLNPQIIEAIEKKVPWTDQETEVDGHRVTEQAEALANLRRAITRIVEFDGDPSNFPESTAYAVGDLSCIIDGVNLDLQYATQLFLSFTPRANDRPEEVDPTSKDNLQYQEIFEIVGLAGICGQHMLYQHEIWENPHTQDKYPYYGRIIRLTTADYERIFW